MNLIALAINAAERAPLPDAITLAGIDYLCGRTRKRLADVGPAEEEAFAATMKYYPVAVHTEEANEQHYEVPSEFFSLVLGPRRKYSSCFYPHSRMTLAEAEIYALRQTVEHADLKDGQTILELGCGWGSLSLFMAEQYPNAKITAVSNSHSQRGYIESQIRDKGLTNLAIITQDMNEFCPEGSFDRIVSVEMFEHMSNWQMLLERARDWLNADGRLFLHVFTNRAHSYRFDHKDPADWIAKHFFTGGIMPAHDLPHRFSDLFEVEQDWRWSGEHYQRTALDWLNNFDEHAEQINAILKRVYGPDANLWRRRWRLFFLATAGLFGHDSGDEWGVGHYLLKPVRAGA